MRYLPWIVLVGVAIPGPVRACSLCGATAPAASYRKDLAASRLILYGSVTDSHLLPANGPGDAGKGVSTFRITTILKSDPWLGTKASIELPRYIPVSDPKNPPKYLLFCDVFEGKLDVFRGVPVQSEVVVAYVKGLMAADARGTPDVLRHCFNSLESPDQEVAADAFLEFTRGSDRDIAGIAPKLSAEKLRGWLKDPKTPELRLGMYAFLLGGCGGDADARFLRDLIAKPTDRTAGAFDGLLGGYIQLRPRDGWDLALALLKDGKQPLKLRFAVVRMLRFYHAWKPDDAHDHVLQGMATILAQNDIADIAVEDLRRWKSWELTRDVLALYGKKGYDSPLVQRALVRYALTCPKARGGEVRRGPAPQ